MRFSSALTALLAFAAASFSQGQSDLTYLKEPEEAWTKGASETGVGNGFFLSPDGSKLVGTFADGTVRIMNPTTGEDITYTPTSQGVSIRGLGGASFAMNASTPYIAFAVVDDPTDAANAKTRCIAITTTGELLFESTPLVGVQAGTPQTTSDGRYILLTHNVNQEVGHFSVLDTSAASGTAIDVVYTYVNATSPFSPIGAYHQPAEGYYDGGEGNTNDMFVWSFATARNASTVGVGQIFGFQLPMDSTAAMAAFPLGEVRDHQASTPPVLTNSGRSLYWAVTRAEQRCWVGSAFRSMYRFNRGRTSTATFARGDPAWISSRAPPSLSSDPVSPFVYGPGAAAELFRMDANFSTITTTNTSWIVSSRVAVSPDDQVIYYADQDGNVAQLDATTLETIWSTKMIAPVVSDIALNKAGTILYVGDTSGLVTALQVATSSAPTPSPSSAGTSDHPSATPTGGGAGEASSVPSISPAPAGSGGGSDGGSRPSSSGTRAPTGGNSTRNPTSGSSSLFKGSFVSAVVLGFAALIATL